MTSLKFPVKANSVAVLGYHDGSAGQIASWFEEVTNYEIVCYVHESNMPIEIDIEEENKKRISQRTEFPQNNAFKGRPLIVAEDWVDQLDRLGIRRILPLTPDNRTRYNQVEKCLMLGMELVSAIHPTVKILPEASIDNGVWINAGSIIGYKAEIETGTLINTGVQIDHHNVIETCCQLDPGVVTAGNVTLRECCHIHTGVTIINRIEIGHDSIIGAGAVVINNIPPQSTAVGVPAKVIKKTRT